MDDAVGGSRVCLLAHGEDTRREKYVNLTLNITHLSGNVET